MRAKTLKITVAERIQIPYGDVSPPVMRKIQERLVFTNPEYEQRHLRGEWIGGIPPQINCIRKAGRNYLLPRGFLDQLLDLCNKHHQPYKLIDRRRTLEPVELAFHGRLKDYQLQAAQEILERQAATLIGGYKSGKTVTALYVIAQRKQPTLVLIPRMDLLEGWITKIVNFLQVPLEQIGVFVRGHHKLGDRITVAHTAEMMRVWKDVKEQVGFVLLDECQRCPAKVLHQLLPNFDSRYLLGLANTDQRRDSLNRLVYFYLGDVVYSINEKDAREGKGIIRAHVVARPTEFEYPYAGDEDYSPMLQALMTDAQRTHLIADDIQEELGSVSSPLVVICGGEEQQTVLGRELERRGIPVHVPAAGQEALESEVEDAEADAAASECCRNLPQEGPSVVLLTPKTLLHCHRHVTAHVLFLAVPLFFQKGLAHAIRSLDKNGTVEAGNGNGNGNNGRRLKIYDYVDQKVGLLENYFRMRSYNYGVHPDVLLQPN
ncbi:hypothetical protein SAMN02746041_03020 [Desulfacinum hydrothermale DSM 13146]|uniref:Helicase ATP-binding domain-containing protein n=1 Tax=Desulfacinum hydrothermale DSM 13146 TaxID=1121390 RepID=A0A1W1XUV8_9BACT|nr:DEAD/DEAH box helicase family protein [Desulfacinum hydrothermale]SMC27624.1 hypothetical protein SAMN02746041_03020 [Desulfacinum hydrothermale DSM 13146]